MSFVSNLNPVPYMFLPKSKTLTQIIEELEAGTAAPATNEPSLTFYVAHPYGMSGNRFMKCFELANLEGKGTLLRTLAETIGRCGPDEDEAALAELVRMFGSVVLQHESTIMHRLFYSVSSDRNTFRCHFRGFAGVNVSEVLCNRDTDLLFEVVQEEGQTLLFEWARPFVADLFEWRVGSDRNRPVLFMGERI